MKVLRGFLSAVLTTLGVLSLLVWLVARFAVSTVEDGSIMRSIASTALDQSAFRGVISDQASNIAISDLQAVGVDTVLFEPLIRALIADTVASDEFRVEFLGSVDGAREDLQAQLMARGSLAPLVLHMDVSNLVTTVLGAVPGLVELAGTIEVDPISIELVDSNGVSNVRSVYGWAQSARDWAGWLGLALIFLGVLISPKRLYVIPRVMMSLGIAALVLWAALRLFGDKLNDIGNGANDGKFGEWISKFLPTEKVASLSSLCWRWGIALTLGALALYLIFWIVRRTAKSAKKHRDMADDEVAVRAENRFDATSELPVGVEDEETVLAPHSGGPSSEQWVDSGQPIETTRPPASS